MENYYNIAATYIGITGVALYIVSYAILQFKRDFAKNIWYSAMNAIAAVLLIISLLAEWNLPSFIGQLFWFVISFYGICRCLHYFLKERQQTSLKADN